VKTVLRHLRVLKEEISDANKCACKNLRIQSTEDVEQQVTKSGTYSSALESMDDSVAALHTLTVFNTTKTPRINNTFCIVILCKLS